MEINGIGGGGWDNYDVGQAEAPEAPDTSEVTEAADATEAPSEAERAETAAIQQAANPTDGFDAAPSEQSTAPDTSAADEAEKAEAPDASKAAEKADGPEPTQEATATAEAAPQAEAAAESDATPTAEAAPEKTDEAERPTAKADEQAERSREAAERAEKAGEVGKELAACIDNGTLPKSAQEAVDALRNQGTMSVGQAQALGALAKAGGYERQLTDDIAARTIANRGNAASPQDRAAIDGMARQGEVNFDAKIEGKVTQKSSGAFIAGSAGVDNKGPYLGETHGAQNGQAQLATKNKLYADGTSTTQNVARLEFSAPVGKVGSVAAGNETDLDKGTDAPYVKGTVGVQGTVGDYRGQLNAEVKLGLTPPNGAGVIQNVMRLNEGRAAMQRMREDAIAQRDALIRQNSQRSLDPAEY